VFLLRLSNIPRRRSISEVNQSAKAGASTVPSEDASGCDAGNYRAVLCRSDGLPGMVASLQTFGSQLQWNPHVHALVSDGLLLPGGDFIPMPLWSEELEEVLTETFRRLVLDALVREDRLSDGMLYRSLLDGDGANKSETMKLLPLTAARLEQ